jgi:hypothetical protein
MLFTLAPLALPFDRQSRSDTKIKINKQSAKYAWATFQTTWFNMNRFPEWYRCVLRWKFSGILERVAAALQCDDITASAELNYAGTVAPLAVYVAVGHSTPRCRPLPTGNRLTPALEMERSSPFTGKIPDVGFKKQRSNLPRAGVGGKKGCRRSVG